MDKIPVAVARGDGIGPEIMEATLSILESCQVPLDYRFVDIGEKVYLSGHKSGIAPETWDTIRHTRAFLKAPITTPQGGGFKSLNVTIRTTLGLYANVRPCVAYAPYVKTRHPGMNVVVIRENEEDLYCGIEYRQTQDTYHALKLITRTGSEKIIRYAFEYALQNGRKKVTCFSKDNILKMTDGHFHKAFEEIAKEYPEVENEHWIVDIGAAKLADTPESFDVIVMPNLYGDILSDVAAQVAGSVGLAGSANIGPLGAMFEAIHGSAPRRAGQNVANPSGLLLAAVMMLNHLGLPDKASEIHNAWLRTLEDGIHTYDIYNEAISKQKVGTREFAQAVIERLNQLPEKFKPIHYQKREHNPSSKASLHSKETKALVGVDIFLDHPGPAASLADHIHTAGAPLTLKQIFNRGVKVWPEAMPETALVHSWRCRFATTSPHAILQTLQAFQDAGLDVIKTENLYTFDGKPGYTVAQDEQ